MMLKIFCCMHFQFLSSFLWYISSQRLNGSVHSSLDRVHQKLAKCGIAACVFIPRLKMKAQLFSNISQNTTQSVGANSCFFVDVCVYHKMSTCLEQQRAMPSEPYYSQGNYIMASHIARTVIGRRTLPTISHGLSFMHFACYTTFWIQYTSRVQLYTQ